jgi:hypothetical protein
MLVLSITTGFWRKPPKANNQLNLKCLAVKKTIKICYFDFAGGSISFVTNELLSISQ